MTTVTVGENGKQRLEKACARLAKRAEKLGMVPPVVTFAETDPHVMKTGAATVVTFPRWVAEVAHGDPVVISGWRVAGCIDHDGANIVSAAPGMTLAARWRDAGPDCQHCGHTRNRKSTTILESESGEQIQIGSNCLADFLDITGLDGIAEYLADSFAMADPVSFGFDEEEEREKGNGGEWAAPLVNVLACTALAIRNVGWTSRGKAFESGDVATAGTVDMLLDPSEKDAEEWFDAYGVSTVPTEADFVEARECVAYWAGQVDGSDYALNLAALVAREWVTRKHIGLAVSALPSWRRHVEKETQRAERAKAGAASAHVGTVGKRQGFGQCTVIGVSYHENHFGTTTRVSLTDAAGNVLVWWSSTSPDVRLGDVRDVTATVKSHDTWQGVCQTVVTRAKMV